MTGTLPLAGIRVVDLTQVQLGPCATQVLGDFGAEIVKVERLGAGDLSRSTDPFITEPGGQSAYFMALNRNKRSLAVDMGKPEGREIDSVRREFGILDTTEVRVRKPPVPGDRLDAAQPSQLARLRST